MVRQAQESEFDSESSDEDHLDTTHGSSKVEQKSPKDVLKAIIESDNRSEAKYPRPSLQLSSQVKIEKPLQEKNSTKLLKVKVKTMKVSNDIIELIEGDQANRAQDITKQIQTVMQSDPDSDSDSLDGLE